MHSFVKWPLLLVLLSACSFINAPSDHQGADADTLVDVGADTGRVDAFAIDDVGPEIDAGSEDAGLDSESMVDAELMIDSEPMIDAGPDDVGVDADLPSLTATEYCARFAELMCAANGEGCCMRDEPFLDCEIVVQRECAEIHGPSPPLPETLTFDGVRAAEAIASLEPLTTTCNISFVIWAVNDFLSPLIGRRAALDACTPELNGRGFVHAALSCDRSGNVDATCQPNGATWQCELRRPAAGECFSGLQCLSDQCTPNVVLPGVFAGTCSNGQADGATCQPMRGDECSSFVCQQSGGNWNCAERIPENVFCRNG